MNKKIFLICTIFLSAISLAERCPSHPNDAINDGWTAPINRQQTETYAGSYIASKTSISKVDGNTWLVTCSYEPVTNQVEGGNIQFSKKFKGDRVSLSDVSLWTYGNDVNTTRQCSAACGFRIF